MNSLFDSPGRTLFIGLGVVGLALALWLLTWPVDSRGLISVLLRFVHVVSAMAWVGLIFFVNFVQLEALQKADEASRSAILRWIVPRVAAGFRHASHLTVLSGVLLLFATGYLLSDWVFSSAVYTPPPRTLMLTVGALGGLLMWGLVHFAIWPSLKVVLGQAEGDADARARAQQTVKRCARFNLVLALPVTFAMVVAAHLS
jgi:uncharacterized membrane protein